MAEFGPNPNLEYVDHAQAHQFRVEEATKAGKIAHEVPSDGIGTSGPCYLLSARTHDVLGVVGAIYLPAVMLAVIGTTGTEIHAQGGGERHV